jgi:hypothetical protein
MLNIIYSLLYDINAHPVIISNQHVNLISQYIMYSSIVILRWSHMAAMMFWCCDVRGMIGAWRYDVSDDADVTVGDVRQCEQGHGMCVDKCEEVTHVVTTGLCLVKACGIVGINGRAAIASGFIGATRGCIWVTRGWATSDGTIKFASVFGSTLPRLVPVSGDGNFSGNDVKRPPWLATAAEYRLGDIIGGSDVADIHASASTRFSSSVERLSSRM